MHKILSTFIKLLAQSLNSLHCIEQLTYFRRAYVQRHWPTYEYLLLKQTKIGKLTAPIKNYTETAD